MSEKKFAPLIEAVLDEERCKMPIFIKALTYGQRLIQLEPAFAEHPRHLERAARLVRYHVRRYREANLGERFPIVHYAYILEPGRSARFDFEGNLLGWFADEPARGAVYLSDGTSITFGLD